MRIEMELRNLPLPQIISYLLEAGGTQTGERQVAGDGWMAELVSLPPAEYRVMSIPRDRLVLDGETEAVERLYAYMRRKTMRGGG